MGGRLLEREVELLFWRAKAGVLIGIFPRAFSDMPRSWSGSVSSVVEEMEAAREELVEWDTLWDETGFGLEV